MQKDYIFLKNACYTWDQKEVRLFLKYMGCNKTISDAFKDCKIIGLHFNVITNDILRKDLKLKSVSTRLSLMCLIDDIRRNNGFFNTQSRLISPLQRYFKTGLVGSNFGSIIDSLDEETKIKNVRGKMMKRMDGSPVGVTPERLDECCKNLVDKKLLVENYLNKDFRGIRKLLTRIPKSKKKFGLLSSSAPISLQGDEVFDIPENVVEILEEEEKKTPYQKLGTISVKLVITELARGDKKKKLFRQIISPVMFSLNKQQEFGIFHAALIVGPWYLEWNNSSLCIPRKCYSKAAVFAADLTRLYKGKIDEIISKVAEVVVEWNATKKYEQKTCNCQHFVDDVLSNLNIRIPYEGSLGVFLDQLRTKGKCEMEWRPSQNCLNRFKWLKKSYKFKSHVSLDEVFLRIQKEEPMWSEKGDLRDDLRLVKAFDRAYWLRYFAKEEIIYKPHPSCPFGNPNESSYLREWF